VIATDVNILIFAMREDSHHHEICRRLIEKMIAGDEEYGVIDYVVFSFLRLVTNSRVFETPTPLENALSFADMFRNQRNARVIVPRSRHWSIFNDLCQSASARGDLITDAWLAALAIEHDALWLSTDRDFARFPDLRWRNPLDA
jgi:uncharacterized protein